KTVDFPSLKNFKEEIVALQEKIRLNSWESGLKFLTIGYLSRILEALDDYIATGVDRFEEVTLEGYGAMVVITNKGANKLEPETSRAFWETIKRIQIIMALGKGFLELVEKVGPHVKNLPEIFR